MDDILDVRVMCTTYTEEKQMPTCEKCGGHITVSEEVCKYCGSDNPAFAPPQPVETEPFVQRTVVHESAPINAPVDQPPVSPQPEPTAATQNRRGRGCLIWLGIVALVGLALYIGAREIEETAERYGENVVGLCNPIRGGQASLSNLPDDVNYPLQIVVFREGQPFTGSLHRDLREAWRADDGTEVDIVVCVAEKQRRLLEACEYRVGDGRLVVVERYQYYNDVVLFNPNTTERIVELRVDGDLPGQCPERVTSDDRNEWHINGREMTFAQFETAIMPYVAP